jgi:hypothetical protein
MPTPLEKVSIVLATPEAIRATALKIPKKALVHMLSNTVADQVKQHDDSFHRHDPWLVGLLRGGFKGYENMTVQELADIAADTYRTEEFTYAYARFLVATRRGTERARRARGPS